MRSAWSALWYRVVGKDVLMVTASIFALIYLRRKKGKGKERIETGIRGIDE